MTNMNLGISSTVSLIFLLSSSRLIGGLVSPRSLAELQRDSDAIVVGAARNAPSAGTTVNLSLQVNRVLKGDPGLAGTVVAVSWPDAINGMHPDSSLLPDPANGLWFLKQSSAGWLLVPVVQGDVPATDAFFPTSSGSLPGIYAYTEGASLADKIASELCNAIENFGPAYNLPLSALQDGALDELNPSIIAIHNQRMSVSASPQQRILGLASLVRTGDSDALVSAAREALSFENYPQENGMLIAGIRDHFRANDAKSVPALGKVATDSKTTLAFRQAAAHALAAIHSVATLPYLAILLNDADDAVRVEAIRGMGSFAIGLPIQTLSGVPSLSNLQIPPNAKYQTADTLAHFALGAQAIQQNENSYISFWQEWWEHNRTSLGF